MVPARLSLVDEWNLVYSLEQDGASLATLYDKCDAYRGKRVGFVLVVKDCEGGVSLLFSSCRRLGARQQGRFESDTAPTDLWRLPFRPPPASSGVLRHWRMLSLASFSAHLSTSTSFRKYRTSE